MHPAQRSKYVVAVAPAAAVDNTTATATEIDTAGWNYCEVVVQLGATDIALTALEVQQSDTSGSGFSLLTGADFDGGTDIDGNALVLPSATDDDQTCVFQINLDATKRYLKVVATAGDGTTGAFIAAVARLSEGDTDLTVSADVADGGVCRV